MANMFTDDDETPAAGGITIKDLSPDQHEVYNSVLSWLRHPTSEPLTLGGYAGTGKSTLVSLVAREVDLPSFCAYTGKASSILRRKLKAGGIDTVGAQRGKPRRDVYGEELVEQRPYCGTIHSLIYKMCECRDPLYLEKPCPQEGCSEETIWSEGRSLCLGGHAGLIETEKALLALEGKHVYVKRNPDGSCAMCGNKGWLRREILDRDYSLIIVDEASMVDDTMLRDLLSYEIPILAVGDHGQLPPVSGTGSLMKNPMLRLEQIHRQAEGNPIIALSKMVREQGMLPDSTSDDRVRLGGLRQLEALIEQRYADASAERLLEMGLACYTNRRRVGMNEAVRKARGVTKTGRELPRKGEHVICLRNMKPPGMEPVYNGMRGVLQNDADWKDNGRDDDSETHLTASVAFPEDDIAAREFDMLAHQFGRERTYSQVEELAQETGIRSFGAAGALFDFGYAMTVHKMQGSQFDDLVVAAERPGPVSNEDWRRWLYTAVTRASNKLTVLR
jgi:exodeoxyribonuclease-5